MPPRVYPCLCGFTCERYPQMRYHRRNCEMWQNRPDPEELTKRRRSTGRRRKRKKCPKCKGKMDSHVKGCPDSHDEKIRRELLERHGVDPKLFAIFLELLAERYADEP